MPVVSGGSGGFSPVSVVAVFSPIDVHAVANYPIKWTSITDNEWDFNALTALPDGIGLTFAFDGSDGTITTTAAGVWAFSLFASGAADAAIRGQITGIVGSTPFGPMVPVAAGLSKVSVVALPSGATPNCQISTSVQATANPYNMGGSMSIVRLA